MNKFWGHLKTITKHKFTVTYYCFKAGLYRQGLFHDMSKLAPVEFFTGVKYFEGTRSPNTAEREVKGVSLAWLHHKGRNKHHLEYWIDYSPDGAHMMTGMKMPARYAVEMFCDRIAACVVYQGKNFNLSSPWEYYDNSKGHLMLHDDTRALLELLLRMLAESGVDKTFAYVRNKVLKNTR